jgi:hypothetical protein
MAIVPDSGGAIFRLQCSDAQPRIEISLVNPSRTVLGNVQISFDERGVDN